MYTVMIMSHNAQEMLKECMDRIRKYTPLEFEFVIVDDASDVPYQFDEPDVTVVRMPRRSDCCNLRNVGMAMSKTEWVFWVDNDCMVGPGWYQPLIEKIAPDVGLIGQYKDARLIRKPYFPLNQSDCMIEYQFAYDFDHESGKCDFITSYCVLVRKEAHRPTYSYGMPTPTLDPELGAGVKANGYNVVVSDAINVHHIGTGTERPGGREYLYHLAENFAKFYRFWSPLNVFELYKPGEHTYQHNANEPMRESSRGGHMGPHGLYDEGKDILE